MIRKLLHIFCPDFDLNRLYPSSILLTDSDQLLDGNEYHVSVGDLSLDKIISISQQFDAINFVPEKFDLNSDSYKETVILLTFLSHRKQVLNFTPASDIRYLNYNVATNSEQPKLWVFGCSHSHGVGLLPGQKKYAELLSEQMSLPLKLISRPGSSTQWSLRHLINADFSKDDVVVWQLTTPDRITWADPRPTEIMLSRSKDRILVDLWNDSQVFFHQMNLINTGVRYLRSQPVKFVLTSIMDRGRDDVFYSYVNEYVKYPEYCYCPGWRQDVASDGQHAGVLSHRALAHHLANHLKLLDD